MSSAVSAVSADSDSAVSADQRLSAHIGLVSADRGKNSADTRIAISRCSADQRSLALITSAGQR